MNLNFEVTFLFQAALDCAIDYAQKRFAFDQPIATFQAIQVLTFGAVFNSVL